MKTQHNDMTISERASFTELIENQEGVILDLENLHYYTLNASAVFLWKQLQEGNSNTDALSRNLAGAYTISGGQAENDTASFLADLARHGLARQADRQRDTQGAWKSSPEQGLAAYAAPVLAPARSLAAVTLSGTGSTGSGGTGT
ncbi:MAG: PqqD family protein [Blastocatellia bacterium]